MKPIMIMFVGLPGTGKTTFLNNGLMELSGVQQVLSSDYIIEQIAEFQKKTYSEVFDSFIDLATKNVEIHIALFSIFKESFVIDQTNLTAKGRARKLNLMRDKDAYTKVAVVFTADEETLKERLTKREETGKVIPASVMKRMQASYEPPSIAEGFDKVVAAEDFNLNLFF